MLTQINYVCVWHSPPAFGISTIELLLRIAGRCSMEGLIRYPRHIMILYRRGFVQRSSECYGVSKRELIRALSECA